MAWQAKHWIGAPRRKRSGGTSPCRARSARRPAQRPSSWGRCRAWRRRGPGGRARSGRRSWSAARGPGSRPRPPAPPRPCTAPWRRTAGGPPPWASAPPLASRPRGGSGGLGGAGRLAPRAARGLGEGSGGDCLLRWALGGFGSRSFLAAFYNHDSVKSIQYMNIKSINMNIKFIQL